MFLFQTVNSPSPIKENDKDARHVKPRASGALRIGAALCALVLLSALGAMAQTNVVTQHYDNARTGLNANETILTPANINMTTNPNSFGKLFSHSVDGWVYAQPLYLPGVTMGAGTLQAGTTHNVLFVATEHDGVYAFDADNNTGANANPLWQITLLDAAHGAPSGATTVPNGDVSTGDIVPEIGITGTPVIDPATNTMYLVGKTKENGTYVQRLHAIDITTGAEKFGGPIMLSGSVTGNGSGSSGGTLNWDPKWENNRPGLLLLNGIVYLGFGSHGDNGPWHGWILAYNASNLHQTSVWCASPNGSADGIWMSGSGLAADVPDPAGHPFGRMFTSTGNGSHSAPVNTTVPLIYDNTMNYGDSIIKLDLANGVPTMNSGGTVVGDDFTPHDQANLNNGDTDQASGGVLLLPDAVGGGKHLLTQVGKTGRVYLLNRESLGGYNPNNTKDPGEAAGVAGMWSMPAYWNGNLYYWGSGDALRAFSISNGVLSSSPISSSAESYGFPGATPTVSANGTTNGIVWSIKSDAYSSQGPEVLFAHDATNVSKTLYSSSNNATRDNPGNAVKFTVPTVINGKVYVGAEFQVSVFGLLNGQQPAATPVISPASQSFNPSVSVTITDSTPGAQIFYTTDGSTPTTASTKYNTGTAINVTTTTTINAIATAPNFLQSPVATATYTLVTQAAMPSFSPAPGSYTTAQSVTITSTTPNAKIYYTTNNTVPSPGAAGTTLYSTPVSISATTTLQAIATATNLTNSPVASGVYTIDIGGVTSINFGSGFSAGGIVMNGSAKLNGTRLRLTDGGGTEAATGWFNVQANIQTFTTDFSLQITPGSSPTADGMTFAIEANSTSVLGPSGGGLGYGPDTAAGTGGIANSVAVKFDLYSNAGEGINSTGIYTNGASPTTPFVDLTGSGIDLHSGHVFNVHMVYDGTNLTMTITDATTNAAFTHAFPINIPAIVGGNSAYVGFTGGTGGLTAIQEVITWTYVSNGGTQPPTLKSIAVTPANQSTAAGTTVQFTATGTYSDNSTKNLTSSVTWASGTPAAATINAAGLATTVAVGSTAISATSGSVSGNTNLTVTAATLKSVAVTPANPSATVGTTVQFHATGTYSDNSTKDITASVTWASGTPATATINSAGLATTVAVGSTAISATSGSVSGNTNLTVTSATLKSVAVTPANPSATVGTTVQFHATGTYSDNSTKDITGSVTWASGTTAAATINSAGLATAVAVGGSAISATSGSVSGNTTLTVTAATSGGVNFGAGFTTTGLALNGKSTLNGTRLRLTDSGANEASSAWWSTLVNAQSFTNDFTFQLSAGATTGDGFAFVIQNTATTALGPSGGGLGYGPDNTTNPSASPNTPIAKSVAVKFDLFSNAGEGTNSTGLYVNGASPTMPATTLGGGVNLHSGDIFKVHMTYNGTTLTMTITDTVNTAQTFTTNWTVNIPATVGGNTAFVGFSGGTGGAVATQEILTWTYASGAGNPKTPVVYDTKTLTAVSSGPTFRQFAFAGFPDGNGTILDATKIGDNVTFTLNVAAPGTYDVKVGVKQFTTRGIWQLSVNGVNFGAPQDEYLNTGGTYAVLDVGNVTISTAGNQTFKFTVTGKNAASSGFTMSFDPITLTPQ
jgi:hypothetical protein